MKARSRFFRRRGSGRRKTGRATLIVLTTLVVGIALTVTWFVAAVTVFVLPVQQPLRHANVIVTLAPAGARLTTAQAAFDQGIADQFWVSHFPNETFGTDRVDAVDVACSSNARRAAVTTCFTPRSDNTIGEARIVAELVEATGIDAVIVTTDVTHSARAEFLFERCLPEGTDVQMLLVNEPEDGGYLLQRMVYETAGFAKAIFQAGSCP